jgi:hypothetical protein
LTIQWSDLHRLNFKCPSFICPPTVQGIYVQGAGTQEKPYYAHSARVAGWSQVLDRWEKPDAFAVSDIFPPLKDVLSKTKKNNKLNSNTDDP